MYPFTWQEALATCTPGQIRHAVESGRWTRVFRGVYVASTGPFDLPTRARAALLATGPRGAVTLASAAELHGFGVMPTDEVDVVVARGVDGLCQPGLRVVTASLPAYDMVEVDGIRCTAPARTAVDLARRLPKADGIAVLDAALRSGTVDHLALRAELDRHAALRGVVRARELVEFADGRAESAMESRLRLVLHGLGLPEPVPQYEVADGFGRTQYRLDLAWPDVMVAAEYDGAVHLTPDQLRHDRTRHNWLSDQGWDIRYFTGHDVYRRPDAISRTLAPLLVTSRPMEAAA